MVARKSDQVKINAYRMEHRTIMATAEGYSDIVVSSFMLKVSESCGSASGVFCVGPIAG